MKKIETERKFLIEMPQIQMLKSLDNIRIIEICQTYTTLGIRLRKCEEEGKVKFIKTIKTHLTDLSRIEQESEISREEYESLLKYKCPDRITLKKTRYCYPYKNKVIEIDIFPFWSKQAFCEVELNSETEELCLPDFIKIIREVTSEKAYRNYALSKEIPKE